MDKTKLKHNWFVKLLLYTGALLGAVFLVYFAPYLFQNSHLVPKFAEVPKAYATNNYTCTWKGGAASNPTDWGNAANWTCSGGTTAPVNAGTTNYWVTINYSGANQPVIGTSTAAYAVTIDGLEIATGTTGSTLTVQKNGTLTISSAGTAPGGFTKGAMVIGNGTNTGTLTLAPTSSTTCLSETESASITEVYAGSIVQGSTSNGGTCTWQMAPGASMNVTNAGTIKNDLSLAFAPTSATGPPDFINSGTVSLTSGTFTTSSHTAALTCSASEGSNQFYGASTTIATTFTGACDFLGSLTSGAIVDTLSGTSIMDSSSTMAFYALTVASGTAATLKATTTLSNNLVFTSTSAAQSLTLNSASVNLLVTGTTAITEPSGSFTSALNVNAGTATFTGATTIGTNTNTAGRITKLVLTTGTIYLGAVSMHSGTTDTQVANSVIDLSGGAGTLYISGAVTRANTGTLVPGTSSTVIFNGTSAQTIPFNWGSGGAMYNNLQILNTAGATLSAAVSATTLTGNLQVGDGSVAAILLNGAFAIVGVSGKTFTVMNNATFSMTGASNNIPTGMTLAWDSAGHTSTIAYDQTTGFTMTTGITYGNLAFKPAGTPTFQLPASITINGNLTIGDGTNAAVVSETTSNPTVTLTSGSMTIASGTFTVGSGALTIGGGLTVNGTLSGSGTGQIYAYGNVSGSGTINLTGNTFEADGIGNFGGSGPAWTFDNLNIGNGAAATTTVVSSATTTVAGTLTIGATSVLNAGVGIFVLSGATPFTINSGGNFTASTSLISFRKTSGTVTVPAVTYYNLDFSPASGSPTFRLASGTVTVNNNLTTDGGGSPTVDFNTNNPALNIAGSLVIGSSDIFSASNSATTTIAGNFTNNSGTFTANGGTVAFDGTSTSTITSVASTTFYSLYATTPEELVFGQYTGTNLFTIAGTFTVAGTSGNLVNIESDSPGNQWLVDFSGAQSAISYAYIQDSGCYAGSATAALFGKNDTDGGHNGSCWSFSLSINVSGTVYDTDASTMLSGFNGSVELVTGTSTGYFVTASGGTFSFSGVAMPAISTEMTIWLNTGGSTAGSLVFRYGAGCSGGAGADCTGLTMVKNSVVIDNKDTANGNMAIADMAGCNNTSGSACTDTDIGFIATTTPSASTTLTFAGNSLYIMPGITFAPGGSVTAGNLNVVGTYTDSNNATFTGGTVSGSGTINMTGGTFEVDGTGNFGGSNTGGWTFNNLNIGNNTSAAITSIATATTTVNGALTIGSTSSLNAGPSTFALTGSGSPFVSNGTFTASTSKISYQATSGGVTAALVGYYNLDFSPGSGSTSFTLPAPNVSTAVPVVVASAGTISDATKSSVQHKIFYDGTRWWTFYMKSGTANTLFYSYSPDLVNWTESSVALGGTVTNNGNTLTTYFDSSTDTVLVTYYSNTNYHRYLRGNISGTTISWSANTLYYDVAAKGSGADYSSSLAIDSNNKVWAFSDDTGANNIYQSTNVISTSFADIDGNWNVTSGSGNSNWMQKTVILRLAGGNMLEVDEDQPSNYRVQWSTWNGSVWSAWSTTGLEPLGAGVDPLNWGIYRQDDTHIYFVGQNNTSSLLFSVFNGTSWNTSNAQPAWPTGGLAANSQIAVSGDGNNVWACVIRGDANSTVSCNKYTEASNTWGGWTDLTSTSATRVYITMGQNAGSGNLPVMWTQTNGANYDIYVDSLVTGVPSFSTLPVNNNLTISGPATVDAYASNTPVTVSGNMAIGSSATYLAATSSPLTISGNFTNGGTFTHNNGTVTFASSTLTSTIGGSASTIFYNLTVTTPGKTLQFHHPTGQVPLFTIANTFTASGSPGSLVNIKSDTSGLQWLVHFNSTQSLINYAFIQDGGCDPTSASVSETANNQNGGDNANCWSFIGIPINGTGTNATGGSGGGVQESGGGSGGGGGSSTITVGTGAYSGAQTSSFSYSVNVAAGSNIALFVAIGSEGPVASASYNSVSMTNLWDQTDQYSGGSYNATAFILANPATGSNSLAITCASNCGGVLSVWAQPWYGVAQGGTQGTTWRTPTTGNDGGTAGTTASEAASNAASGDMVLDVMVDSAQTPTANSSQTVQKQDNPSGSLYWGTSSKAASGSTNMVWIMGSTGWGMGVVPLIPASGSGGGSGGGSQQGGGGSGGGGGGGSP